MLERSVTKLVSNFSIVNINGRCQVGCHLESNGHQSCHTDTLPYRSYHTISVTDDQIQNHMSFEKIYPRSKKTRMSIFSKVITFHSKIPVEAPIFIKNQ